MKKTISLIVLALMLPQNAYAVQAGQYCKAKDSMKIVQTKTKMVQCIPSGANSRLRWTAVK